MNQSVVDPERMNGTETILLVEDEEGFRRLISKILGSLGYRVLEAGNAEEAIEIAQTAGPIQLLLTDIVMPGMDGPQLANRLEHDRTDLRVLLMSGYTDDAIMQSGRPDPGRTILKKPFTPAALARSVRTALA